MLKEVSSLTSRPDLTSGLKDKSSPKDMTWEDLIVHEVTRQSKLLREQEKKIQEFIEALEMDFNY